jgi:hypothetical protein
VVVVCSLRQRRYPVHTIKEIIDYFRFTVFLETVVNGEILGAGSWRALVPEGNCG